MNHRDLIPLTPTALSEQDKIARLVSDFLAGRKQTTLRTYRQGLLDFAAFLAADSITDAVARLLSGGPGEANHLALLYRINMTVRNLAANTINSRLTALRSVVRLARRLGIIAWTLDVDGAESRTYRNTAGPGLDVCRRMLAEVTRRIDGARRQRVKAVRDRAILRLLFDLALRRSSITALDFDDVDLEARTICVWSKGHGDEDYDARFLPGPTVEAVQEWIELRGDEPGPLFFALASNSRGRRLSGTAIWRIIDNIARAVGEKVWPHGIRHTSISEVVDQSRDVRLGRILAGHGSISTTQRYLDNLESGELDRQATGIAAGALGSPGTGGPW